MKKQDNSVNEGTLLRLIAEEELKNDKPADSEITEFDNLKLIHELRVYQIELEMQNEELKKAQSQAYEAITKYVDLYDFAPSGYISLSKDGDIIELNYSAAAMLGNDRIHLKNKRFGLYISHDSLKSFNNLLHRTFIFKEKESCELILLHKTDTVENLMVVQVEAQVSKDYSKCMLTLIDISARKKMEVDLEKTLHEYKILNSYFVDREIRMVAMKKEINELLIKAGSEKRY
jgi:PAS domain-containing protein